MGTYASFAMGTVAEEDASRSIWPSCPGGGWLSGVDRLTSAPNGKPLSPRAVSQSSPESHGPYVGGNGFPTDEAYGWNVDDLVLFAPPMLPSVQPVPTGPQYKGWFKSEFGCVTYSSFESVSPFLSPDNWALHSSPMHERSWPVRPSLSLSLSLSLSVSVS